MTIIGFRIIQNFNPVHIVYYENNIYWEGYNFKKKINKKYSVVNINILQVCTNCQYDASTSLSKKFYFYFCKKKKTTTKIFIKNKSFLS